MHFAGPPHIYVCFIDRGPCNTARLVAGVMMKQDAARCKRKGEIEKLFKLIV